jgi:hypothetical protein
VTAAGADAAASAKAEGYDPHMTGSAPLVPAPPSTQDSAFLLLQEACLAVGLTKAVAGSVERLRAMAEDPERPARTRIRADQALIGLARHVAPAPAKVAVDARSAHVHIEGQRGLDRAAYQRLLENPSTRDVAAQLLDALAPSAPPVTAQPAVGSIVEAEVVSRNGKAPHVNGEAGPSTLPA